MRGRLTVNTMFWPIENPPPDKMLAISEPDRSGLRSVTAGARGVGALGQLGQLLRLEI